MSSISSVSYIHPISYFGDLPIAPPSKKLKDRLTPTRIYQYLLKSYRNISKPKVLSFDGIKLNISDNLQKNVLRTLYIGDYEKRELKTVKSQLESDDVVMELGTGLGLISSFCANKIGSEKVFTYEANPQLEPYIRNNYKLNNVSPNLNISMLGESAGSQPFYVNKEFWASSTVRKSPEDKEIIIPVKSFNDEVRKINPTLLIIDIEGGEYSLFQYADLHNVKKICIELHNDVLGEEKTKFVLNKLADQGFLLDKNLSYDRELFLTRA